MYADVYLWSTLLAVTGLIKKQGRATCKLKMCSGSDAKATMNALYLMVAAIAKDATSAIVFSSPFMMHSQFHRSCGLPWCDRSTF